MKITSLHAREVLDSRGNPTVEAEITIDSRFQASAIVPSGASTGEKEAVELRDGDLQRYKGKGVLQAVGHVNGEISYALLNKEIPDQAALDRILIELDGTPNKSRLGANAILAVSIAFAKAMALARGIPLYAQLETHDTYVMPVPCMNVINGGRHADNSIDFQEFMIAPHRAHSFREAIRMGIETFQTLKEILRKKGYVTAVGDEGGFAPNLSSNEEAIEIILEAIVKAGYAPGDDISICIDPATSELWEAGRYVLFKSMKGSLSRDELLDLWVNWVRQYPIVLLEDGMAENDWDGWKMLTQTLGNEVELVGDDIFCTNPSIFQKGIEQGIANSILIKLNQIGTVTETLQTIQLARQHHYKYFISHRSGETEDTTIADLAVATCAGHIKTGSGCRGERIAKFNRLLRIEEELGHRSRFAGKQAFIFS
ncbi:phosphopyruvate hydratase [Thermoflavifilum thermophilum]|uniref:Enolase n=1 Tax=Thermoflavifilum thermophilum TaxID=1393122 RepID=A0A1I7NN20_9BACT|nr:phosphopyruvate hydratase [Thermoflavifilum thermophilum]SFV36051.1 enolase [Thermoflavifilum thermophilum]